MQVLTTDADLLRVPWARALEEAGIHVEQVAGGELLRRAGEADVVVLPVTPQSERDCLELVPAVAMSCSTPVLLAVEPGCDTAAGEALDRGARGFLLLPYVRTATISHLRLLAHGRRSRPGVLRAGRVALDVRARQVTLDGVPQPLRPKELDVLRVLMERAGEVVSAEELHEAVWGRGGDVSNTLAVHVTRLRRRLETDPARPALICTVRGSGYCLRMPPER